MATESSRSNSTANSYVGSLISLISKSEIRYEGILYNINTDESSIGLRNVRSFGTEGRKKDGPQVMPSNKVYEYILFRGSDIKDLQVKSSPPVQPTIQTSPPINNDPAIIQSHYPVPFSTSSSLLAAGTGSLPGLGSHSAQLGQHGSNYQGGMPLYQPGGSLGSCGPTPPPAANDGGLATPMYWPGFYAPPNGLPQLHQQSLLQPPPGLSIPNSMQYPTFNVSMPAGASNVSGSKLTEYPLPTVTTSLSLSSTSVPSIPAHIPPVTLPSEAFPSFMQNKAPNSATLLPSLSTSLPSLSQLSFSSQDINVTPPPTFSKAIASPSLPYQGISQPISSVAKISSSIQTEMVKPVLVTPGHLLPSGKFEVPKSQSLQTAHKDVEVVQVSSRPSELPDPAATEAQPPILPLPTPSHTAQKPNGAPYQTHHNNCSGRERGRGPGNLRPMMKFTEEFDFTAMNEKFNKDEVWGHLGKSNKSNLKWKEGDEIASEEDSFEDEGDAESPQAEVKPVYIKDDFFDSLSSNAVDNQSNNGRTRFSEQRKLDTETFGEFSRYLGRGRGPGRGGGGSRGGYYGRGYGYAWRGRGQNMASGDY